MKGVLIFCGFVGGSPSEVVERVRGMSDDELVDLFREFFVAKRDSMAPKTLWNSMTAAKALLLENGVRAVDRVSREITREFRRVVGPVKPLLKKDLMVKEEIVRVLSVAPLRERAIIALMASSGLRVSAALGLTLSCLKDNIFDDSLPCYMIEVPEELSKEGQPYITFCSWEAAEYIREYLRERERAGEKLKPDSPLFLSREGGALSRSRFENVWRELCREAGIDMRPVKIKGRFKAGSGKVLKARGYRYNVRPHSLRKFFRTTLAVSGVDRLVAEALMGHSLTQFGIESIYNHAVANLEYLRSEYLKAVNNLLFLRKPRGLEIINGEARKRIEELEKQLKEQQETIRSLTTFMKTFVKTLAAADPEVMGKIRIEGMDVLTAEEYERRARRRKRKKRR